MAYQIPGFKLGTLVANADYSAKQFYLMKVNSSGNAELSGAGEAAIGVLQNEPASGKSAELMTFGVSKVQYGNTVTQGQQLMSDANGKAVPHTGTNEVIGVALESGSSGEIGTALISISSSKGNSVSYGALSFHFDNTKIADGDLVTGVTPGFAGTIEKFFYVVTDPVTTGSKLSDINLEIGSTDVTGGVIELRSATMTPLGAVVEGSAITADNTFGASDTISIKASSTTSFAEGTGTFVIVYSS